MWNADLYDPQLDRQFGRDIVAYYNGKQLPRIRGIGTLHPDYRQIRITRDDDGKRITLHEFGGQEFPSDALLAQVILVAGA